jgi:tetratricopeptide (TPR) repeat protein
MDGRILRIVGLGLLASTVGCNSMRDSRKTEGYQAPVMEEKGSMVSKFFGNSGHGLKPNTPPQEVVVRDRSKAGKGLGAESEVALATASQDAAYMKTTAIERDQMLDLSRQRYQQALKIDPKNRAALIGLGRFYAATGDKANAVACLRTATQLYPNDHELYHRLAAIHFQFDEPAESIQATQQALKLDPSNRTYIKTLALAQAHMKQWDSAFNTLMSSRVMTESEARYFLGRALMDQGQTDAGREQIQTAANIDEPTNKLARQFLTDLANGGPPQEPIHQVGYESTDPPLGR